MATDYSNRKTNRLGKMGEDIVFSKLQNNEYISKVYDARDNIDYQKIDVDFVIYGHKKNEILNVEVKTDDAAGRYGNFFIEDKLIYFDDREEKGWLHYSKADKFIIYVPKHKILYMFSSASIKDYINKYNPKVKSCDYDRFKKSYGYCVNIDDFCSKYNVDKTEVA